MSQKNGHALESVTLTAMLRRWTSSLLLIAVAAAGALSAMILQNLTIRQENALCNTIENTTISCTCLLYTSPFRKIFCQFYT